MNINIFKILNGRKELGNIVDIHKLEKYHLTNPISFYKPNLISIPKYTLLCEQILFESPQNSNEFPYELLKEIDQNSCDTFIFCLTIRQCLLKSQNWKYNKNIYSCSDLSRNILFLTIDFSQKQSIKLALSLLEQNISESDLNEFQIQYFDIPGFSIKIQNDLTLIILNKQKHNLITIYHQLLHVFQSESKMFLMNKISKFSLSKENQIYFQISNADLQKYYFNEIEFYPTLYDLCFKLEDLFQISELKTFLLDINKNPKQAFKKYLTLFQSIDKNNQELTFICVAKLYNIHFDIIQIFISNYFKTLKFYS